MGLLLSGDLYDLQRFVEAQSRTYESALSELRAGQKRGHWMWYVFPQLKGLGVSPTSRKYAISSSEEASAYWKHAVLGPRLQVSTQAVIDLEGSDAYQIFCSPDNLKFHSCMALFARRVPDDSVFNNALDKYFDGRPDHRTLKILGASAADG